MTAAAYARRYANAALEGTWLILAAMVPVYYDLIRSQPATPKGLLLQIAVALMLLLWLVQRGATYLLRASAPEEPRSHGLPRPLIWLALAYAATTLLSAVCSPLPTIAFWGSYLRNEGAIATASYVMLFLIVADRLRDRQQFERLVSVLLAAALLVCVYGIAQALRIDPMPWEHDITARVVSTIGNALFLASYLLLLVPLTLWRALEAPRPAADGGSERVLGVVLVAGAVTVVAVLFAIGATHTEVSWAFPAVLGTYGLLVASAPGFPSTPTGLRLRRFAYLVLLCLQGIVLLLTASIGPLGALLGAPLVVAAVATVRRRRWRELLALGSAGLFVVVVLGLLTRVGSPLQPLKSGFPLIERLSAVGSGGAGPRGLVWQAGAQGLSQLTALGPTADALADFRPLIGYGPETITFVLNRVLPPAANLDAVLGEFWDRSHNALLDRLLTTGVLGLAAYVAFIVGVLVVAIRRAGPELDARRLGPHLALLLALLAHLLETQLSMLILPAEGVFWLLAAAAVGGTWDLRVETPGPLTAVAPARAPGQARRGRGSARPATQAPSSGAPWLALGAYAGFLVVLSLLLIPATPPSDVMAATVAALVLFLAAPCVFALGVRDGGFWRRQIGAALLIGGTTIALALAICGHQVRELAADVYFKRAETSHAGGDLAGAIANAQGAIRVAPDQAEYYYVLGQYYATLAGRTRNLPVPSFEPTTQEAITTGRAGILGRDQLFELGSLSLEEAVRLIPVEPRYFTTLGELHRYWAEIANDPSHLAKALASFQQAGYLKPNDAEIYAGIADALLLRQDPARAVDYGARARDLLPNYWYPYSLLAQAYRMLGWSELAHDTAELAISAARRNIGFKTATSYDLDRLREVADATRIDDS
jgi:tetratricopeptide (TPR) repeat protein/O-antigen ligase